MTRASAPHSNRHRRIRGGWLAAALAAGLALALPAQAATAADAASGGAQDLPPAIAFSPASEGEGGAVATGLAERFGLGSAAEGLSYAAIDVNDDGVAEIALRHSGDGYCFETRCETRVIAYSGRDWKAVFTGRAERLALSAQPVAGVRQLVLDGGDVWAWNLDRFTPTVPLGERLLTLPEVDLTALPDWVQATIRARHVALEAETGRPPAVRAAALALRDGADLAPAYAVALDHVGLCSRQLGCPVLLVAPPAGGETAGRVVLQSMGQDSRVLLSRRSGPEGWRDVALVGAQGLSLYRWQQDAGAATGAYALLQSALPITAVDAEKVTQ